MPGLYGMPGIEGLGRCALCGKNFVGELLGSLCGSDRNKIRTIRVEGIDGDLCVHLECLENIESLQDRDASWEELPPGPLRSIFESHFGDMDPDTPQGADTP